MPPSIVANSSPQRKSHDAAPFSRAKASGSAISPRLFIRSVGVSKSVMRRSYSGSNVSSRPMPTSPLELTRAQILAFRRRAGALDERLPRGARSLRRAAWAGLTDSVPRAALLSIHARVEGTQPSSWEDPSLVQVWGPRGSVYVVPARDRAVFTLGQARPTTRVGAREPRTWPRACTPTSRAGG